MKKILVVISHYLPGYKAGGPIRTVASMVEGLGDELAFYVLTADRDLGENQPYPSIIRRSWQTVGKAQVRYLSPRERNPLALRRLLNSLDYDLIYFNSFFSPLTIMILLLRRLGWIVERPVVLAPRGEFSPGALNLKWLKKRLYIALARRLGLYRRLTWHASTADEARHLQATLGPLDGWPLPVRVAANLPSVYPNGAVTSGRPVKRPGEARFIFLSRIARKKNLDVALKLLAHVDGRVQFDVYGPVEDPSYWHDCQGLMTHLPPNVKVKYGGEVRHEDVLATFSQYHLFLFPTRGENFGHVILEALAAGCLALISDQTPWRGLQGEQVGWDIPLNDPRAFTAALREVVYMDNHTFEQRSGLARAYAERIRRDPAVLESNRRLFMD
ncbi:MAG: glycosyltransferase [Chloroflexota bacterium]